VLVVFCRSIKSEETEATLSRRGKEMSSNPVNLGSDWWRTGPPFARLFN
jgi:hypothetical protein